MINQGDVVWVELDEPRGSQPGYRHSCVVVQNNLFNHSNIRTVVVCALTLNLKRSEAPGNVLLDKGEGNLSKQSVVNVSQILTVDKTQITDQIGKLSARRVKQISDGIKLVIEPREVE